MIYLFDFRRPKNADKTAFYIIVKDSKTARHRKIDMQQMKEWSKKQPIKMFEVHGKDRQGRAWERDEVQELVDKIIADQERTP